MRKFYLLYQDRSSCIPQQLSEKSNRASDSAISQMASGKLNKPVFGLSWSQYVFLIGLKDANERSFYEIESTKNMML